MADLAVHAGRAVVSGHGGQPVEVTGVTVVVDRGMVSAVGPRDPSVQADEVVTLAPDEVLLPGLVDTHVHVNEPGRTEWEGFATATAAAAAGGVTTLLDMPLNSIPPTLDPDALAVKRRAAAGQCAVDVGFWGGAVPGNLGRLGELLDAGVFGVKCFLPDSGVPEFPALGLALLEQACREVADRDGLLLVHAEDPAVLAGAPECAGPAYAPFLASRPAAAEDQAIAAVVEAARLTGARVHVVHLSSAGAIPLLEKAKADGVRVTVETCPHYLVLTAEQVPAGRTAAKCCPPVRDEANRDLLWDGLRRGVIDLVVSDHSPATPELKETGDFGTAWGGIAGVQLGLPLVWTEARRRGFGVADVVRWMCTGPAALAGLQTKGALAVGEAADLVVFAPDESWTVNVHQLKHRNPVSPYAGRRLDGVVRRVWLAGRPVDEGSRSGRLLSRGEA